MGILDEIIKEVKEAQPDFDINNPHDLNKLTKSIILGYPDKKISKEMREDYLTQVIERQERENTERVLKKHICDRNESISIIYDQLLLEKDIIERKIKVIKEFMD